MAARPSRSASIPIPGSTGRSIEDIISMPFTSTTPSRARLVSGTRLHIPSSPERPLSGRMAASTSPVRTVSGGYPTAWARPPAQHTASAPVFEPRIIRATAEPGCTPAPATPVQLSPSRTRRPSVRRQSTTAAPTIATTTPRTSAPPIAASSSSSSTAAPTAFPRPAYLEHSALRDLLYTDAAPSHAPSSVAETATASRMSTPVPVPYPYLRRDTSPGMDTDEESMGSSPPPISRTPAPAPAPGALLTNPALRLPTRWSEQDRHHLLTVSGDGRELTFYGQSCSGDRDSAAARANHPIPPACGIYYYEVEILQKGAKGHISIGFSSPEVRLSRLPGWEKQSWGYHADDGWSFPGHKDGNPYGPTFDTGDVIGCGIDFTQHRAFYTKNGNFLGMVFENVGKSIDIYPSVGLRHTSESIRVNFGHGPFRYAIEDHVHAQRNTTWANIQATPIDWGLLHGKERKEEDAAEEKAEAAPRGGALEEEQMKAPLRNLVLSYLAHHGYARTARAFQAQCEGRRELAEVADSGMDLDDGPRASTSSSGLDAELDLRARIDIVNAVLKGDIDTAIVQTQEHHPVVLEREQGLMLFKLRCRKFVELILEASDALKRVQVDEKATSHPEKLVEPASDTMDGLGAMDVDDPSPEALTSASSLDGSVPPAARDSGHHPSALRGASPAPASAAQARAALEKAIEYGQRLEADYRGDLRAEVRSHLKRTFGVVAFADPLAAGGEVAEMAGQEARARLANELNQAILESQGKPAHPALETLYRQTAACVVQLGLLGAGSAAFADMNKEFLEA
ncbi:SPRY-domain-containing protein [Phanerochaete sordida]|uniref:SPRY-domain-containing protein n=1 Tax=Phanerochaete sordida TaxID=48140 RepID=A0A9P3GKX9_9APHY|nr:SPRY-domain-containing protein [Phanerochaete sordida]